MKIFMQTASFLYVIFECQLASRSKCTTYRVQLAGTSIWRYCSLNRAEFGFINVFPLIRWFMMFTVTYQSPAYPILYGCVILSIHFRRSSVSRRIWRLSCATQHANISPAFMELYCEV